MTEPISFAPDSVKVPPDTAMGIFAAAYTSPEMLRAALPLRLFLQVPAAVPATPMDVCRLQGAETSAK